jgi:hypothetical protein
MPNEYDAVEMLVDDIQVGSTLLIRDDSGQPCLFQVERKKAIATPDAFTYRLTSEPVDGEPWVRNYPAGTVSIRILRIRPSA